VLKILVWTKMVQPKNFRGEENRCLVMDVTITEIGNSYFKGGSELDVSFEYESTPSYHHVLRLTVVN
jgi:hypothetical protein